MANIVETDNWPGGVYQYADGDVLGGGPNSSEVLPLKQLAQRSLYQRLRNVTDWDAALAAAFGYPAGACVRYGSTTWRAIVANNVAPGTDAAKWEKWGYSESELDAKLAALLPYGAPIACPNTGPDASANKAKVHKSALGEYWLWLGDAWRVVAGLYRSYSGFTNYAISGGGSVTLATFVAHRAGEIRANVSSYATATNGSQWLNNKLFYTTAGYTGDIGSDYKITEVTGRTITADAHASYPVSAGDSLSFIVQSSHAVNASARYHVMYAN